MMPCQKCGRAMLLAAVGAVALAVVPTHAANWAGGDGVWSTGAANWGGSGWSQGDLANFPSGSGTVTLGENILASGLTLNANAYTINLAGNDLTVSGTSSGTSNSGLITSATGGTYTTGGFGTGTKMSGNINVVLTGGSWTPSVSHDFTGTLTLKGTGTPLAAVSSNSHLGSAVGKVSVQETRFLRLDSGTNGNTGTFTRDIEFVGTAATIGLNGARGAILAGKVSGVAVPAGADPGINFSSGQGVLTLAGANTFNGAVAASGQNTIVVLANNKALGNSTNFTAASGLLTTLGFRRTLAGADLNIDNTASITLSGNVTSTGLGMIHNYEGDNAFAGNISLGSNTLRTISVESDSSLKLSGIISSGRGFMKHGDGTLILTNANTYGTSSTPSQASTTVAQGKLLLDFSQAPTGINDDIINNLNAVGSRSQLILSGGTLEIKGRGATFTNTQKFEDSTSAGAGFAITSGASTVTLTQNGAASLSLNVGSLLAAQRAVGGTVKFDLPATGAITLPGGGAGTVGTTNQVLSANGAAFATVGLDEWASISATRAIITGTTAGLYNANGPASLSGNADMSAGNTTLSSSPTLSSLRFNNGAARTIDATGQALTTGGILVTPNVGANTSTITGGVLRGNDSGTATLQDLVLIQNNTAGDLVINSSITDAANTAATGLTKSGAGVVALGNANTYTGITALNGGVLKLNHATALPGGIDATVAVTGESALQIKGGGVLGLTAASGDFNRALYASGTGNGQVRFLGSGGFAAYDGERVVRFNNDSTVEMKIGLQDSNPIHLTGVNALVFGAADSNGTVNFTNLIRLSAYAGVQSWEFRAIAGSVPVAGKISGVIRGDGGLTKTGDGTLELSVANTYLGATTVQEGTLLVTGSLSASSLSSVEDGGTLKVSGTGKISGPVTVNSGGTVGGNSVPVSGTSYGTVVVNAGGTISPGSSAGVLTLNKLTMASSTSQALMEIDGTAAGSFDQVVASGTGNNIDFAGVLQIKTSAYFGDTTWNLFDFTSRTGTFETIVDLGGNYDTFEFDPTTGILSASAVPEPASIALLAMAGGALVGRRRRQPA